jgi:Tol biopolymer transport system component
VAFAAEASNLVPGDTNDFRDVFVHDRQTGQTSRVSVASDGTQGDWPSGDLGLAMTGDGRFVAFESAATNLVPDDTNSSRDVFVHDRQTGQTARVSVASDGTEGNLGSGQFGVSISADGQVVAFPSSARNLVPGDTNITWDVFVHDRQTPQTTRVSVASDGTEGDRDSTSPRLSADGRFVAFSSNATNLVPNDTNGWMDVFVHDRQTGQTSRVSVASDDTEGNGRSGHRGLCVSPNGRFVAFTSEAWNLVPGGSYSRGAFVHDRQTGQTTRVGVTSDGTPGTGSCDFPSLSADGRFVAFQSASSNLVPNDTNGASDVFVHDRQTGQTSRVSVASDGAEGDLDSGWTGVFISADGCFVAFDSRATNLVAGDTNDADDVFVRDLGVIPPTVVHVDDDNQTGAESGTPWQPFDTLQEGIDAVAHGGTVKLAQGAYAEGITLSGKRVTLAGGYVGGTYPGTGDFSEANRDPAASPTTIDGGGSATQVVCQDAAARGSTLDGLTFRNGGTLFRGGIVLRRVITQHD